MRVKEVKGDSLVIELLDEPTPGEFVVRREIELGKENLDGDLLTYWDEREGPGMLAMTFEIRLWNYSGGTADIEIRWLQTRAPEQYGCRAGWRPSQGEGCRHEVFMPIALR